MDNFNNEDNEIQNTIIELNSVPEDTLFEEDKISIEKEDNEIKVTKKKKHKGNFYQNFTRKQKTVFLVIIGVLLLLLIAASIFFYLKKHKKKPEEPKEVVIIENDNYIYENGTLKFLNDNDKVIGTYDCQNKNDKKCFMAKFTNEDDNDLPLYLDEKGNKIERNSSVYENKYVFVNDGDAIYLYNIQDKKSEGEYLLVKNNNNFKNLFVLKDKDKKYGIIDITNETINQVLDFNYEYLEVQNSDGVFVAKSNERSFLVDKTGKELTSKINGVIKSFTSSFMAVYDTKYELLDYAGKIALPNQYDYIDFVSDYILAIDGKKVYVFNVYLDKLNEEGIKIKSSEYQRKYIFDSNNNLLETKKPYDASLSEGHFILKYDNNEKSINIYEALLNKNIPYINYYDSVLYFYSDEDKENLIGSYKCSNKNTVYGPNDEYKSCFIAKDENILNNTDKLGYIPIINNNYVFIYDNKKDAEKPSIKLYDLKNSKQISEYQKVDTGLGKEKIEFASVLNNLVYAQNMSGSYGVITFGANGPSGVIAFNDSKEKDGQKPTGKTLSISILKDYFYVKRENANLLYDKTGNEIARSLFEITDYYDKYIIVKDKNYLVYSSDGKIVSSDGKFIKFNEKFFVLIDPNNKFNIYSYKDGKNGILQKELIINNTNYDKAYEINETDENYIITLISNDGKKQNYMFDKTTGKEIVENNNENIEEGENNEG